MKTNFKFLGLLLSLTLFSCGNGESASHDKVNPEDTTAVPGENQAEAEDKNNSCVHIAIQILTTSPTYLEKTEGLYEAVVANGGTSFGLSLEGSPDPDRDGAMAHSETYDFSLHETYPDHSPVIERFTFNPGQGKLYLYDIVEDQMISIDFDQKLLKRFNQFCK